MRSNNHPLSILDTFPDTNSGDFSRDEWIARFSNSNVIIHCLGKNLYYPTHWGPLSVKCAFRGKEYYQKRNCKYAVSEENFLLLNEGTAYSSYIEHGHDVESLTINFNQDYQMDVRRVLCSTTEKLLDQPFESPNDYVFLEEKLFQHNSSISPHIFKVRCMTRNFHENLPGLAETLYFLLEALIRHNAQIVLEIKDVQATRFSTKKEIYRRLNEVKDYIDSCSNENISLESLSKVALMSSFHLLRQFKKNYHLTPYQYLIGRRLEKAKEMLAKSDATLSDICFTTGFMDASSFSKLFKKRYSLSPQQYRDSVK